MSTRRCPACGGLVSADLEWCSQCFTRFDDGGPEAAPEEEATATATEGEPADPESPAEGRPAPDRASPEAGIGEGRAVRVVEEGRVLWDCPVCGQENDLETSVCSRCGTTFGRLFEEPQPPPRTSPERAAVLSLLVPGAGHVAAGRVAEGVARAVIFAFTLGMVVAILAAGGGLGGPLVPLVVLFVGAAATLYLATAVDAFRAVRREPPVLSTRLLLIGATVLLMVAVAVLIIGGQRLT
jgi:hypothetical protein